MTRCYRLIAILTIVTIFLVNLRIERDELLGAHQDSFLVLGLAVVAVNEQHGQDPEHAKEHAYPTAYHRKSAVSAKNRNDRRWNRNRT